MSSFVARRVLRSRAPLPRPPLRRTLATAATTSTSDSNTPPVSDPSPDTVTSTDADASINLDDLESVLPDFKLPPEKLRHLIALFHEAGSFVTRETLDERILDAFIRAPETSTTTLGPYQTYQTLRYRNARRKNEPETAFQPEYLDEDGKVREKRVFETLYGTGRGYLPGLELMLESWNAIESRLTNDESERQGMVVEGSGREKGISSVVANLGKKPQRSPWSTETR